MCTHSHLTHTLLIGIRGGPPFRPFGSDPSSRLHVAMCGFHGNSTSLNQEFPDISSQGLGNLRSIKGNCCTLDSAMNPEQSYWLLIRPLQYGTMAGSLRDARLQNVSKGKTSQYRNTIGGLEGCPVQYFKSCVKLRPEAPTTQQSQNAYRQYQ